MSVLFGMWNFDGRAVDPEHIANSKRMLEAHAPDGVATCVKGASLMLYGALHTTDESLRERQPLTSPTGTILLWDGRLDNRAELQNRLDCSCRRDTDIHVVASTWERQGTHCFEDLIGDWALCIFNHFDRSLVLAKDFLGARPLYYFRRDGFVAWSSLLEPLIALSDHRLAFCDEYLAGWLAGFPEAHLTPYQEIRSVPPASFVRITNQATKIERYWDFPARPIRLQRDAEYEERFRALFFNSVKRRLRSNSPVLAELSGGMDSSAIVCAADRLTTEEGAPPVETVSFFDDSEPNWNERPFFTAVETQRHHTGFHLEVASDGRFLPERDGSFPVTPARGAHPSESQERFSQFLSKGGFRVLLSGIGGDEFTGGVPTGIPELADLLVSGNLRVFVRTAFLWSLASRKPFWQVVCSVLRSFLPRISDSRSRTAWPMPWVRPSFLQRNQQTLKTLATRFHWRGPSPTFQANLHALDGIRRQIACAELPPATSFEKRYPFLDRDLLQFLFNVPRDQLVRPNQRRSLLRRALRGIVPDVVLNRPRKAFVVTSLLKTIATDWTRIEQLVGQMSLEARGVIDSEALRQTLEQARSGQEIPLLPLMRVLRFEWWMQDEEIQRCFRTSAACTNLRPSLRAHIA